MRLYFIVIVLLALTAALVDYRLSIGYFIVGLILFAYAKITTRRQRMEILDYVTAGGKNVIIDYIDNLSKKEQLEIHKIRDAIVKDGLKVLLDINTRQLKGKLWEIKVCQNRIMYVIKDENYIYFLHVCKKQKNKAEKFELKKAIKRAKKIGLKI